MSNPKFYPRWIKRDDGASLIVKDHIEHSSHMGQEFDEDANLVVRPPLPPALQEIIKAGYEPSAAEIIFEREAQKAAQGIIPYGAKPLEDFIQPPVIETPNPIAPSIDESEFNEPFYPPAAEQVPGEGAASPEEEVAESSQSDRPDATEAEPLSSGQEVAFGRAADGIGAESGPILGINHLDPLGIFEPGPTEPETAPRRRSRKKTEAGG